MTADARSTEYHGLDGGLASVTIQGSRPVAGQVRAERHARTLCLRLPVGDRTAIANGSMLVVDYHAQDRVGWAKVEVEVRTDQGGVGFGWLGGEEQHGRARIPLSSEGILSRGGLTVVVEVVVATYGGGATAVIDSISLGGR